MKTMFAVAAVLSLTAAINLTDFGVARASRGSAVFLTESSGPTWNGHDTAVFAEGESSGPTNGGRDTALSA